MFCECESRVRDSAYLVKHRTIGTDVCSLVVLLLADSRNTTRTKSGGASTDELSETTDKLELRPVRLDAHLLDEDVVSLLQVLEGVVLDVGEEGGVERVRLLQRADVGTLEELDLGLLVQVDEDQAELVRRRVQEHRGQDRVDRAGLARSGRAGDQDVRHLRQVHRHGLSGDVLAQPGQQRGCAVGTAAVDVAEADHLAT